MAYIFGKGTPDTYESLQAKRRSAMGLQEAALQTPQNLGQGLSALGRALAYRSLNKQVNEGEAKGRGQFESALAGLFGQPQFAPQGQPQAPMPGVSQGGAIQSAPLTQNPQGLPQSIIGAVDRVDPPMGQGGADFGALEAQYGLPPGYLSQTYQIESGGNPNAQNPNSSAGGGFQFIDSTAKQYGLTDKTNLGASADAAARLAADNKRALVSSLGREPTAGELYLAHQQGGGGAAALLSNPNARAVDIVGADAVRLNGGDANMTAGQFASKWTGKFGGQPQQTQGGPDMGQLMGLMDNPYARPGEKMALARLFEMQLGASSPDPLKALQLEKAQLELEQMRDPAKYGKGPEYGLQPVYGHDKDGNLVLGQLGKDGTFIATKLPDGVTPDPAMGTYEKARGTAEGKGAGEVSVALNSMRAKMPGLESVVTKLGELSERATYTYAGQAVDAFNRQLNLDPRDAAVARTEYEATVSNQILPLLRDTFGAQFTQKEGETLRETLGDPNKSPKEKQAVLTAFIEQKRRDIEATADQAEVPFNGGGPQGGSVLMFDPATGDFK
jgi:Transglycosylase SLT domain